MCPDETQPITCIRATDLDEDLDEIGDDSDIRDYVRASTRPRIQAHIRPAPTFLSNLATCLRSFIA